ncbi:MULTISPECIES: hypothetical protein [unclassified Devosia]|uniref:hypothetical protein n=1 Tax=unclassified Devosia TaxID=196773 RepID=UPI00086F3FBB|nr:MULTISPECIES: hypothetical protein [unclassified Devosia]MBN9360181.1 hypothetical protein [Devosia sp.]ODS87742.1 MAG: hypothetical protein ABS47_11405 [Devosia sp. SCN 66-27]OJX22221.1 MAG: hypothetical protein BGO83_15335 [Devosia sp. 66-14]
MTERKHMLDWVPFLWNDAGRLVLMLATASALVGWIGSAVSAKQAADQAEIAGRVQVLNERRTYLADLRERYIATLGDGIPQMLYMRQGWPPDDWMNAEIAKDNLGFNFRSDGPRFEIVEVTKTPTP